MILVLAIWVLVFLVFSIIGFSVVRVIEKIKGEKKEYNDSAFEEYFFFGFFTISSIAGILSIFIPIGSTALFFTGLLTLSLFFLSYREIIFALKKLIKSATDSTSQELILLSFLVFFILTAVVQNITWLDTQSYHAQNIQWIRKYAVVPGLGNLHDRFAFNSMFFLISALFTFQIKDILIFPLNGICYIILIIKLFSLYKKESNQGATWKAVFYILTILISLLIMIPNLNTPSPDIICAILTIYAFVLFIDRSEYGRQLTFHQIILLNFLVFTCVSFKLSSLFIVISLLLLLDKEVIRRSLVSLLVFILIISSFLIRNYYLSGYLIYPFPAIDIFSVDWKIPLANVIETKSVIEGWAKIPLRPYQEVLSMKLSEWIFPWFKQLSFNSKLLLTVNLLSVFTLLHMLYKKEYFLAKIQLIILINLVFWFIKAPDLRFAYGFIFLGFSLTIAYLIKLFEYSKSPGKIRYIKIGLTCFLILIIFRRILFPVNTLRTPALWIHPAPFGTVETIEYSTNFYYRIPIENGECFYTDIPCVIYPLKDVYLRGSDFQDGFRVIKINK